MIPGIVAASGNGSGPGGVAYPGAIAVADFVNGFYQIDGVDVTAADMIDRPDLVTVDGLAFDPVAGPTDVVAPLGDFLAALVRAESTIVVDAYDAQTGAGNKFWLTMITPDFVIFSYLQADGDQTWADAANVAGAGGHRQAQTFVSVTRPGRRKTAFTRQDAGMSISSNGNAVVIDASGSWGTSLPMTDALIGGEVLASGTVSFKGFIRSIIVYPVQSNADLPALSTP